MERRVVVTGLGAITPIGNSICEFWNSVKEGKNGIVLAGYMIFYSIGRFFIEGLRTDSLMFMGLRIAQIVSLIGILLGVLFIIYINKVYKTKN